MNLNQLEYFVSVAELKSFTKAAEKCYITQTAISQQIRALEEAVGVPLLIRDKHHVELTAAGEVYLNEARAILRRSSEAIKLARSATEGITGSITIGFIRGYADDGLADLIRTFHRKYPGISISFCRDNMNGLYSALETGKCDLAFNLSTSLDKSLAGLSHRYFSGCALTVALPLGHRLSGKQTVKYSELSDESFIIMQPPGRPRDEAEEVMVTYERGGFIPRIVAAEGEPETLLLMVSSGAGVSILPEYIVKNHAIGRNVRVVPIVKEDGTAELLEIELSWKSEHANPIVSRFLEEVY